MQLSHYRIDRRYHEKIASLIAGGFIATLVGLTSVVSSFAGPVSQQATPAVSNVEQIQYQERRRPHYDNRRDRHGNWNGHRGNRDYRHGHRRYNQEY